MPLLYESGGANCGGLGSGGPHQLSEVSDGLSCGRHVFAWCGPSDFTGVNATTTRGDGCVFVDDRRVGAILAAGKTGGHIGASWSCRCVPRMSCIRGTFRRDCSTGISGREFATIGLSPAQTRHEQDRGSREVLLATPVPDGRPRDAEIPKTPHEAFWGFHEAPPL